MSNLNDLAPESFAPQAVIMPPAVDKSLDDEMREVVLRFEEIYAELAPATESESPKTRLPDDALDLADDIGRALRDPPPPDPMPFQPRMRREPELAHKPHEPRTDSPQAPSSAKGDNFEIEEALSILRAAETKARSGVARDAKDEDDIAQAEACVRPIEFERQDPVRAPSPAVAPPIAEAAAPASAEDWSSKSKNFWSIALIAAAVALSAGTGVGYLMGRGEQAVAPTAKIKTLPDGGAKLRPDYDLRSR